MRRNEGMMNDGAISKIIGVKSLEFRHADVGDYVFVDPGALTAWLTIPQDRSKAIVETATGTVTIYRTGRIEMEPRDE